MKKHWASPYVQKLIEYNPSIINGYTDGTFKPDATLRKDELVKLLVVAFQLKADSMPVYLKDHNNWAKEEIETIAKLGIDVGTNLYFKPDTKINRESVALMVYRVLVPSERISAEKNPAINKNSITGGNTGGNNGSTYPDGWVAPVLNHTWSSNPAENRQALQQQLGFDQNMAYNIPQQTGVIRVLSQEVDKTLEVVIQLTGWSLDQNKYAEAYKIKPIAKEVFKLYFGPDYMRVYNYFETGSIPDTFTANGRTINCKISNGAFIMYVGVKK